MINIWISYWGLFIFSKKRPNIW